MTAVERSEVRWGTTEIPYVIRRSARRGTVGIAVDPAGTVVLTAPQETPVLRLDRLVREKARWIVARVRRRQTLPAERPREIVSGETCLYLGKQYRLRLRASPEVRPLTLRVGWLELPVPPSIGASQQSEYARAALMD